MVEPTPPLLTGHQRVVYRQPHTEHTKVLFTMPLIGQVITHDQTRRTGVIRIEDTPQAVLFAEDDFTNKPADIGSLIGQHVMFDVVQTANGVVAVNIRLARRKIFRPGEWLWLVAAPLLVLCGMYGLRFAVGYPFIHAYVISINFVAFLLSVVLARQPMTYETRPLEISLFLVAACGGALSALVASYLVLTKFRTDAGRFALFAMMVAQMILLYRYKPAFFSQTSLDIILLKL